MKRNSLSFSFLAAILAVSGFFAFTPIKAFADTSAGSCEKIGGTCDCACEEGTVVAENNCFESGAAARCGGSCTCETQSTDTSSTTTSGELPEEKGEVQVGPFTLHTDPAKLGADILEIGIGIGALLAVLFTIVGGFGVASSAGDPDKLEKAKAQITASVSGLIFLLASALILKYILGTIIGVEFF